DYVSVGNPLYRLVDVDPLKVRIRVPERRMAGVVPGLDVQVTIADQAAPLAGRVSRIRPEIDPRTRSYEVEVEIPNPDLRHAVGAFGVAVISVGEDDDVTLVAKDSVVVFAGVKKVFVPG